MDTVKPPGGVSTYMIFKKLWSDQRGSSLTIFMLTLPALIAVGGLTIDTGLAVRQKLQLQGAVEAAAMGAANQYNPYLWETFGVVVIDPVWAEAAAELYLAENMPTARLTAVSVDPAEPNTVTVSAEADARVFFAKVFGQSGFVISSMVTISKG